ncbi:MAG: hypothetical protein LCH30_01955 [Proteobacteria bacterium]|nr:hypothetical protein [Pseudomonadota bacterium]
MLLKNTFLAGLILTSAVSYAGNEDWTGVFNFADSTGKIHTVNHSPTKVSLEFFNVGSCLSLSKGTKINGLVIKENVNLCVKSKVSTFTNEVQKLGTITRKNISLGPNYKDE